MSDTPSAQPTAHPAQTSGIGVSITRLAARFIDVRAREWTPLLLSFGYFYCVLCSYYILRPLRDEMGVTLGRDNIQMFFAMIFLIMLAAVPLVGWVVKTLRRGLIVPFVYGFFILNLLMFWVLLSAGFARQIVAGAFFIWIAVYVLFVVSLFWSFMSDIWSNEPAKRVYGAIAVGGTAGGLTGPLLIQIFINSIGVANLLLMSAFFLTLALVISIVLRRHIDADTQRESVEPASVHHHDSVFAGALNVVRSPYLLGIAFWILISNMLGMFFYLDQMRIVGEVFPDQKERVLFFTRMETAVSVLTILLEVFVTGFLLKRIGVGRTLAILPVFAVCALIAFAFSPSLALIAIIMVLSRAMGYGLAGPALRVLFTVIDARDKYRAQNFVDTLVHRGGNALSAGLFNVLTRSLGATAPMIALASIPAALAWVWLSLDLGKRQDRLAGNAQRVQTGHGHGQAQAGKAP